MSPRSLYSYCSPGPAFGATVSTASIREALSG